MSSIDVLTLQDRVATALSDELGRYVWGNGETDPAIQIESGVPDGNLQPERIEGLEVVIQPYTNGSMTPYLGGQTAFYDEYRIWLKQHNIRASVATAFSTLFIAIQDIVTGHIDAMPRNTALDSLEQAALIVKYRRI